MIARRTADLRPVLPLRPGDAGTSLASWLGEDAAAQLTEGAAGEVESQVTGMVETAKTCNPFTGDSLSLGCQRATAPPLPADLWDHYSRDSVLESAYPAVGDWPESDRVASRSGTHVNVNRRGQVTHR